MQSGNPTLPPDWCGWAWGAIQVPSMEAFIRLGIACLTLRYGDSLLTTSFSVESIRYLTVRIRSSFLNCGRGTEYSLMSLTHILTSQNRVLCCFSDYRYLILCSSLGH